MHSAVLVYILCKIPNWNLFSFFERKFVFLFAVLVELAKTWFMLYYIQFFFTFLVKNSLCGKELFDTCSYMTSWDAACMLQKPRRMTCSLPSKNKMNKHRNMPAVLKYYIFLLMFQALRPFIYQFSPEGKILGSAFEVYSQSFTWLNSDDEDF